ncbi:SDR family NAD(P)-dependent oxidoreductase, partial [bacterium]|nr:SDR family NAD(P)-dependent oxidoreductase [bacterium]
MLQNKTAIVTGAAQGIGKAIALALAREGANVVVSDVNLEQAQQTAMEVEALGVKSLAVKCNVADAAEVDALVKQAQDAFPAIDILVNNAGVTRDNLMMRMSEQDWDLVLSVNLKGAFLMTKAVSRVMMRQRSGRIINMASVIGVMGNAGQANYAASKGGLIALTKSTAKEFASRNVTCNAVAPGFIETAMTAK